MVRIRISRGQRWKPSPVSLASSDSILSEPSPSSIRHSQTVDVAPRWRSDLSFRNRVRVAASRCGGHIVVEVESESDEQNDPDHPNDSDDEPVV